MHELPITQNILNLVLSHASEAGGGKVTGVHLTVGELSSVVDESVQFYWDVLSEGTSAEGAKLHFTHIPMEFACLDCRNRFQPGDDFICPSCSGKNVRVAGGEDLRLEAIDIESGDEGPILKGPDSNSDEPDRPEPEEPAPPRSP
jgi:hydrogenase nickel incorporation protein HypA/HybF